MPMTKEVNSRYIQLDLITGKETDFHVWDIKLSVFNSAVVDLLDVARRDYMEYFDDKILQLHGNPKIRGQLARLLSRK